MSRIFEIVQNQTACKHQSLLSGGLGLQVIIRVSIFEVTSDRMNTGIILNHEWSQMKP